MTDTQLRAVLKAIAALAGIAAGSKEDNDERLVRALEDLGARADRAYEETRPPGLRH